MKKMAFDLYRIYDNSNKLKLMHIEEDKENKNYYIKVEADNIEDMLSKMMLPDRLKQQLREDIVIIVKGYNKLITGKFYSEDMVKICNKYFSDTLEKFCFEHGNRLFEFDIYEEDIDA